MYTKAANLVIQIVLVVAAVVIFAYIDPFGIFIKNKRKLKDTPITVVSIREIGQLITAEYYGEVISSLQNEMIEELDVKRPQFDTAIKVLVTQYASALKEFYAAKDSIKTHFFFRRSDSKEFFYTRNPDLVNHPLYPAMVDQFMDDLNYSSEKNFLNALRKDKSISKELEKLETTFNFNTFKAKREKEVKEMTEKKSFKKKQMIVLGRGWVKAGIDFGSFNENNMRYDKGRKIIYLYGIEPEILNRSINPWFNAKQRIKGFEIITATKSASTSMFLDSVKAGCLDKLTTQAMDAGILQQAKNNAEQSLKQFFSLLLEEQVEKVEIVKEPMDAVENRFRAANVFAKNDLPLLDSLLLQLDPPDSTDIYKEGVLKFSVGNEVFPLNRFSALACRVSDDNLLSLEEKSELENAWNHPSFQAVDTLWYLSGKKRRSIDSTAVQLARKKARYVSKGFSHWKDSVLGDTLFLAYKKAYKSSLTEQLHQELVRQHNRAIQQSIIFLRKRLLTIQLVGNGTISDSQGINQYLADFQ